VTFLDFDGESGRLAVGMTGTVFIRNVCVFFLSCDYLQWCQMCLPNTIMDHVFVRMCSGVLFVCLLELFGTLTLRKEGLFFVWFGFLSSLTR